MKKAVVGGVTTDYTYYVDGLRRSKKTGSNTSYEFWDGDNIIADTVSGYTIANNYIRGLRLAEISNSTATRQYTFNAHGDVTGLVDTTTGAVTDYTYDAYGNEDNASATDTNPFRYSGEYYDAETGFIYLRARYYDPSIGRFTAEDTHWTSENMVFGDREYQPNEIKIPSIEAIRQSINLNIYALNNPVKYSDVTGESAQAVLRNSWILGGGFAGVDGMLPYGDIIGGIIGLGGTIVAGGVWVYDSVVAHYTEARSATINATIASIKEKDSSDVVIYRSGSGNATNLTPREVDITGLSYSTVMPTSGSFTVTSINTINATGVLKAVQDGSKHVSVSTVNPSKMKEWIKSRPTALLQPHEYTKLLQNISTKIK